MDMPMFALGNVLHGGSPRVKQMFACDHHIPCQRFLNVIHPDCETVYSDITERKPEDTPATDLYIWGPPCQSFSVAGLGLGRHDERGRLPKYSLAYIRHSRPPLTIMETGWESTHDV